MRRNPRMTAPLNPSITDSSPETLVVFDLRVHGARSRLNDQKRAWGRRASVERLDKDHSALIVRAGGARRIA